MRRITVHAPMAWAAALALVLAASGQPVDRADAAPARRTLLYLGNSESVTAIDAATGSWVATIPVTRVVAALAVSPDRTTLYAASSPSTVDQGSVVPIDLATNRARPPIRVGVGPRGLVVSRDGRRLLVTESISGRVDVVDVAARTITRSTPVDGYPGAMVLTADGRVLYVAKRNAAQIVRIDVETGRLIGSPIWVPVPPGAGIHSMAMGRNHILFVAAFDRVERLDTVTNTFRTPIRVLGDEHAGMALSADGRRLVLTNLLNGSVQDVDTATGRADTPIPLGGSAYGVVVDRAGRVRVAVATRARGRAVSVGSVATVDLTTRLVAPLASHGDGTSSIALIDVPSA